MTQEKMSPLRARMIEDMRIRGMAETSQKAHIRALKDFTAFLGRAPDTASPDELRAYQLHMTDTEVTPSVYNARINCPPAQCISHSAGKRMFAPLFETRSKLDLGRALFGLADGSTIEVWNWRASQCEPVK